MVLTLFDQENYCRSLSCKTNELKKRKNANLLMNILTNISDILIKLLEIINSFNYVFNILARKDYSPD